MPWPPWKRLIHRSREFSPGLGFSRLGHRLFVSTIPVPPWGVGILNRLGSVHYLFVTAICVQGSPGCLDFMDLSSLCVSQVAHHPMFIEPGIRQARTIGLWSRVHIRGKWQSQQAYQIHPACPGHIWASLGGLKKLHHSAGLVWQPLDCGSLQPPLKLLIWWFNEAGEYLFPGGKHPLHLQRSPLVAIKMELQITMN